MLERIEGVRNFLDTVEARADEKAAVVRDPPPTFLVSGEAPPRGGGMIF